MCEEKIVDFIVHSTAREIASRRYVLESVRGIVSGSIYLDQMLNDIVSAFPEMGKVVSDYLHGYWPEYKKGRDEGRIE